MYFNIALNCTIVHYSIVYKNNMQLYQTCGTLASPGHDTRGDFSRDSTFGIKPETFWSQIQFSNHQMLLYGVGIELNNELFLGLRSKRLYLNFSREK